MAEDKMFRTSEEGLPHRCVEVVYMTTLLRDGYGFPEHSRNVTYALEADGMEVRHIPTPSRRPCPCPQFACRSRRAWLFPHFEP